MNAFHKLNLMHAVSQSAFNSEMPEALNVVLHEANLSSGDSRDLLQVSCNTKHCELLQTFKIWPGVLDVVFADAMCLNAVSQKWCDPFRERAEGAYEKSSKFRQKRESEWGMKKERDVKASGARLRSSDS